MVKMTHWDGATGAEFARDTGVELDIKRVRRVPPGIMRKETAFLEKESKEKGGAPKVKQRCIRDGAIANFLVMTWDDVTILGRCQGSLCIHILSDKLHVYPGKPVFMDHEPLLDHELFRLRNSRK